jgi:hypothetical protein
VSARENGAPLRPHSNHKVMICACSAAPLVAEPVVRGGAASGNRTPDLLITRRPYPASYGVYQQQQLQISHLRRSQGHRST